MDTSDIDDIFKQSRKKIFSLHGREILNSIKALRYHAVLNKAVLKL